ncbi:hypothetical protein [Actinomadura harenae]|uniref:hypothetical protein n=1 Tax=Actinomadura harenae TaxID=2483351 RepID=UPI0013157838|nr:hypothetical protein [Actinomadura harenae]
MRELAEEIGAEVGHHEPFGQSDGFTTAEAPYRAWLPPPAFRDRARVGGRGDHRDL